MNELFPFPDECTESGCTPLLRTGHHLGDLGLSVTLRSLNRTTAHERAIVADCLVEVAQVLRETQGLGQSRRKGATSDGSPKEDLPTDTDHELT
jgi:hypothetical protein